MSKRFATNPEGSKPATKKSRAKKNPLAPEPVGAVTSESNQEAAGMQPGAGTPASPAQQPAGGGTARRMEMADLKLVRSTADRKNKRLVIYNIEGRTGSVQFLSTLFGGDQNSQGNPPESLTLSGEFAEPKAPKAKETPEERKARLAALPKPTLAEKVAKAEERAAKLREKLAKAAAAQTAGATA